MQEEFEPDRGESPAAVGGHTPADATAGSRSGKALPGHFLLLVAATYCLIVLGALVRANDAGLACPDWPLCFGDVIPQMNIEVAFEWSHRTVAAGVALVFATLSFRVLRRPPVAPSVRRLLLLAAVLLLVQIVLGSLTVLLKLASWTVTAHLITGNSFALTALLLSRSLRDRAQGRVRRPEATTASRVSVLTAVVFLFFQMVLGGLVASKYAGLACPEWPTCNGGEWFPAWGGAVGLHIVHRLNGYALCVALGVAAILCRRERKLGRITAIAVILVLCEVLVGVANVLLGIPSEITGLHSAFATALVLTLTLAVRDLLTRHPIPD